MNSVILCEGSTDYTLLQYYMRKAYGWQDNADKQKGVFKVDKNKSRKFYQDGKTLTIAAVGGCSKFDTAIQKVIKNNSVAAFDERGYFQSVVLITDRDESDTEQNLIHSITQIFQSCGVQCEGSLKHNQWIEVAMKNAVEIDVQFHFLLLIIPFTQNGAMETFLLEAVAEQNPYDKVLIDKCNNFVDTVDVDKRYLKSRRLITKAKYDTYFSIRTPVEQFEERQNILKNIKWEEYTLLQKDFELLSQL